MSYSKEESQNRSLALWLVFFFLLGLFISQSIIYGYYLLNLSGTQPERVPVGEESNETHYHYPPETDLSTVSLSTLNRGRFFFEYPSETETSQSTTSLELTSILMQDTNLQLACSEDNYATAVANLRPAVVHIQVNASGDRKTASIDSSKGNFGSGVIVDPRGYLLTNYHLIAGAGEITVTTFGFQETKYLARVVKIDIENDLAILKIDSKDSFPVATLGNSDLIEIADTVIAIGSPFGLEQTVTMGIISDDKRDFEVDGKRFEDMIQTDAAINRGNSGGPLINITGEVIGINTAIYSPTAVFVGLGFAIPINKAKSLLQEIYR